MTASSRAGKASTSSGKGDAKEYELDGHIYGRVSAAAVAHVRSAQKQLGITGKYEVEQRSILELAAERAEGDDAVLMSLFTYGRFEYGLPPRVLSPIIRKRMMYVRTFEGTSGAICSKARMYFDHLGVDSKN